jgi:hypothetical protein
MVITHSSWAGRCPALAASAMALLMAGGSAQAAVYTVNQSFTEGPNTAVLTGTVSIPIGSYVIQNSGASPFTSVNLSLTVNGVSYGLSYALTDYVFGTGQFLIEATPTSLTFNTANADDFNPADLIFSDNTNPAQLNRYAIGSDGDPGFELAHAGSGILLSGASFPLVFGAIPEPSAGFFAGAFLALHFGFRSLRRARTE